VNDIDFDAAFLALTGNPPFPWQKALYDDWFSKGKFPDACTLPTGLGKTSVIAVWLIALAHNPAAVPRRLVYVVNRRTVVDQTTNESENLRANLPKLKAWFPELALSTLRGQFADNREWSADPSRPAVICGTVDMIGSRLLFSGYGIGFKSRPLHAGFLGQDVLLVHDEAHLEKPFQDLLTAIKCEQGRCKEFGRFHVMALTATPRGGEQPFELTDAERNPPETIPDNDDPLTITWKRLRAKKLLTITPIPDEKQVDSNIVETAYARGRESPDSAILIFVRTVEGVDDVRKGLRAKKIPEASISSLTGTMRGLERNRQADPRQDNADPVFARFLKKPKSTDNPWKTTPRSGTVYLICTAAGEVGVDISADHLICDLTPFDSMAQRFGRVNRYGTGDSRIDVIHEAKPNDKKKDDLFDQRRWLTLKVLRDLNRDASPYAIGQRPIEERIAGFTPTPTILPVTDFLFDAWALTTIKGKLPGRPVVEPYLHGISEWQPPETYVAWRNEVWEFRPRFGNEEDRKQREREETKRLAKFAAELIEDFPLKPHEFLRDSSSRVYDRLKKLKAAETTPVWIVSDDDKVDVTSLGELILAGKEEIERKTVLLAPSAGGLENGLLSSDSKTANDVSDDWFEDAEQKIRRRIRIWNDDEDFDLKTEDMRLIRRIDMPSGEADEDAETRSWHWFELVKDGDSDGSKSNKKPVLWEVHVGDVVKNATDIVNCLPLSNDFKASIIFAARFHDHGKRRKRFQIVLGNFNYPEIVLAKSGKKGGRMDEPYRHEFGSLLDVLDPHQEYCAQFQKLNDDMKELVLHLIAVHHGYGRPHFPSELAFDPEPPIGADSTGVTIAVVQRFARLQRKYGRWGLAYLESLLRAADYHASANPSSFLEGEK
jgi:CRISPR-associated endonuclease/helicase Cas3